MGNAYAPWLKSAGGLLLMSKKVSGQFSQNTL